MFGYQRGALAGRDALILNAAPEEPSEQNAEQIIGELTRSGGWSGKVDNLRADGSQFWSWASGSAFEHRQHGLVWIGVHTDLSTRAQG